MQQTRQGDCHQPPLQKGWKGTYALEARRQEAAWRLTLNGFPNAQRMHTGTSCVACGAPEPGVQHHCCGLTLWWHIGSSGTDMGSNGRLWWGWSLQVVLPGMLGVGQLQCVGQAVHLLHLVEAIGTISDVGARDEAYMLHVAIPSAWQDDNV